MAVRAPRPCGQGCGTCDRALAMAFVNARSRRLTQYARRPAVTAVDGPRQHFEGGWPVWTTFRRMSPERRYRPRLLRAPLLVRGQPGRTDPARERRRRFAL